MQPRFIIFIADRLNQFQFPRIDQFQHSKEFDRYIYKGRTLDIEEFNEAAKRIFSPDFRGDGFTFCPQVVEVPAGIVTLGEFVPESVTEPVVTPTEEQTPAETVTETANPAPEAPTPLFRLEGKGIFIGDERVAGLYGESMQLRVFKDEFRQAIEEWLASQPSA